MANRNTTNENAIELLYEGNLTSALSDAILQMGHLRDLDRDEMQIFAPRSLFSYLIQNERLLYRPETEGTVTQFMGVNVVEGYESAVIVAAKAWSPQGKYIRINLPVAR